MVGSMSLLAVASLKEHKVVPIIIIDEFSSANGTFEALTQGGLPIAEITLRTPIALKVIELSREKYPDLIAGAGTVLNSKLARDAISAGAQFLVSPGYSQEVLEAARTANIPYIPGVATATEIQRASNEGLILLKFFPSEQLGGLPTISALGSAFVDLEFMPSGGVNENNYLEYLAHPKVPLIGGSWVAPRADINAKNFVEIVSRARKVVSATQTRSVEIGGSSASSQKSK